MNIHVDEKYDISNVLASERSIVPVEEIYRRARDELAKRGKSGTYAIGVPDCDERLCFHEDGAFWVVYYSERGRRTTPSFFISPFDAIFFFVETLTRTKK